MLSTAPFALTASPHYKLFEISKTRRLKIVQCFQVSSLNSVEQKAGEFIGVSEGYLCRKVSGHVSKKVCMGFL